MRSDVSYVGYPNRIWHVDVEVLLQLISSHDSRLGSILTWTAFITDLRPETFASNELCNGIRRAMLTQVQQVMVDLAIAIYTAAFQPRLLDKPRQVAPALSLSR